MANEKLAHKDNKPGDFFVDTTCIDCPICRETAPTIFGDARNQAIVVKQPDGPRELLRSTIALVSCPAASIGTRSRVNVQGAIDALPELIDDDVYWCGFASESSYGAQSYIIKRKGGNVLIDSPRFAAPLVKKIEKLGGIRYMFLTHKDDVADHEKFREHFGAEGIIHKLEALGPLKSIERQLDGDGPWDIDSDLKIIFTPGHTEGHTVLLYKKKFLFTGDHLAYSRRRGRLVAFKEACWYSWPELIKSMKKLLSYDFEWVLPGHGRQYHADKATMKEETLKLTIGKDTV